MQAFTEVVEQHAFLDVQFCVGQAFGESWAGKRARIKAASAEGSEAGWDLVSIIVKSNDDMRQEVSERGWVNEHVWYHFLFFRVFFFFLS